MTEEWKEETRRKIAVMQAALDGQPIEIRHRAEDWAPYKFPNWNWGINDYRVAEVPHSINWDHVAPEFIAMVTSGDGGPVILISTQPLKHEDQWTGCGRWLYANSFSSFRPGNLPWDKSLVWRPGHEPKGGAE